MCGTTPLPPSSVASCSPTRSWIWRGRKKPLPEPNRQRVRSGPAGHRDRWGDGMLPAGRADCWGAALRSEIAGRLAEAAEQRDELAELGGGQAERLEHVGVDLLGGLVGDLAAEAGDG